MSPSSSLSSNGLGWKGLWRVHLILRETVTVCGHFLPRPAEVEAIFQAIFLLLHSLSLSSALDNGNEIDSSWWEDSFFGGGLSLFLTIVSLSHIPSFQCCSLQHTVHTGYASPACLFPNLDKCVASWAVSNLLWKLSAEKALAAQSQTLKGTLGGDSGRLQKPLNCSLCSPANRNSNIHCSSKAGSHWTWMHSVLLPSLNAMKQVKMSRRAKVYN